MGHFRKTIKNYHDRIFVSLGPRQPKNKIHANVFPWCIWYRKGNVQPRVASITLCLMANHTTVNQSLNILPHLRPKEVLFYSCQCLITTKVTCKTPSMCFPDNCFSHRTLRNAQSIIFEKIFVLLKEFPTTPLEQAFQMAPKS